MSRHTERRTRLLLAGRAPLSNALAHGNTPGASSLPAGIESQEGA